MAVLLHCAAFFCIDMQPDESASSSSGSYVLQVAQEELNTKEKAVEIILRNLDPNLPEQERKFCQKVVEDGFDQLNAYLITEYPDEIERVEYPTSIDIPACDFALRENRDLIRETYSLSGQKILASFDDKTGILTVT